MQQVWGEGCPASHPSLPPSFYSSSPALVALSPSNFQPSPTCGSVPRKARRSAPLARPSGEVLGGLGLPPPPPPGLLRAPVAGPRPSLASAAATATGPEICDSPENPGASVPTWRPHRPACAVPRLFHCAVHVFTHRLARHPSLSLAGLMAPPGGQYGCRWSMVGF